MLSGLKGAFIEIGLHDRTVGHNVISVCYDVPLMDTFIAVTT